MSFAQDTALFKNIAVLTLSKVYDGKNITVVKDILISVFQIVLAAGESGVTTRDIAEKCDMSIYAARNWLIKLENCNVVSRSGTAKKMSWHRICE